jgi:glycosyltransferase involved in cell wall biosynthesis
VYPVVPTKRDSASMDLPFVSMILTTRDRPGLLPVAIACYRQQTYPHKELIVVDDGERFPVDADALRAVGGRLVRVAPDTPLGVKLNRGIEAARGPLCQKMDDDDWYAPGFLASMVLALMEHRREVCIPAFAFMMPFLFFELARWEIRQSVSNNIPGATLLFFRDDWANRPFRAVRFDEDTWFVLDRARDGLAPVPVRCLESFLAIRHGNSSRDRGHTWVHQGNGQTLESYLQGRALYHRRPEDLLPEWVLPIYRQLR